ncbi:MAG: Rha family transcriptional regulator [Methylobacter sp.]|uniref:Rha family transcriptional regulator n=1 Tax=Methylobacter sp. TaxID=2051955 RepID=UPI0025830477|nr:Rha family transcriptional regulator [Methylobacter sp.]MCL7422386.1 Rha family transcriptional regulator [Methylobacter sp.]
MGALVTISTNPVVHVRRNQVTTSSLDVAEYFGKQHKNVLQAIQNIHDEEFTELNFQPSTYKDSTGRKLPAYEITKDGFAMLAMGFTGKKAEEFKIRYINAFNRMLADLPDGRDAAIHAKRVAHQGMTDAIKFSREQEGKEAKPHHFMNENKLCNWAAFGSFKTIDESTLSAPEAKLLERVRNYNETLIWDGVGYADRKAKLKNYADRQRRYLMPAIGARMH